MIVPFTLGCAYFFAAVCHRTHKRQFQNFWEDTNEKIHRCHYYHWMNRFKAGDHCSVSMLEKYTVYFLTEEKQILLFIWCLAWSTDISTFWSNLLSTTTLNEKLHIDMRQKWIIMKSSQDASNRFYLEKPWTIILKLLKRNEGNKAIQSIAEERSSSSDVEEDVPCFYIRKFSSPNYKIDNISNKTL